MRLTPLALSHLLLSGLVLGGLGAACTAPVTEAPEERSDEQLATTSEALVDGCRLAAEGTPCDPDGSTGPAGWCDGKCVRSNDGHFLHCVAVPTTDNIGLPCGDGTSQHVSCSRSCDQAGQCVAVNATHGAACKPAGAPLVSAICDGVCESGSCKWVAKPGKPKLCGCARRRG